MRQNAVDSAVMKELMLQVKPELCCLEQHISAPSPNPPSGLSSLKLTEINPVLCAYVPTYIHTYAVIYLFMHMQYLASSFTMSFVDVSS